METCRDKVIHQQENHLVPCKPCGGTGKVNVKECRCYLCEGKGFWHRYEEKSGRQKFLGCVICGGNGRMTYKDEFPSYTKSSFEKGSGRIEKSFDYCPACNGQGRIRI